MKVEQRKWTLESGWDQKSQVDFPSSPQIVYAFGSTSLQKDPQHFEEIKAMYPQSHIITCSTAGEILDTEVSDNSLVVTAVLFEKSQVRFVQSDIVVDGSAEASLNTGKEL